MFVPLARSEEILKVLVVVEPHVAGLKEKINEEGGEVSYEDVENVEVVMQFMRTVYASQYGQFADFLKAVDKFSETKRKSNKFFNLVGVLKGVLSNLKAYSEQTANFLNANRQAVKIIDEVYKKSTFEFANDEKNKDKVKSTIYIYPEDKQKLVS